MPTQPDPAAVQIREISTAEHEEYLRDRPRVSFLQNPRWAQVKTEWKSRSLGWFAGDRLVGAALVLTRGLPVPGLRGKHLAYIPDGPVLDRDLIDLPGALTPLVTFLRSRGAFLVRMGLPAVRRTWDASVIRRAVAADRGGLIPELDPASTDEAVEADIATLQTLGWQAPAVREDFPAGQPQFQARIPLTHLPEADRVEENAAFQQALEDALMRMDATSRRQTRRSTRSELRVVYGATEALPEWHRLYSQTAERDGFTGRPLAYFQRMVQRLNSPLSTCSVLHAYWGEELLASAVYVQQGDFGWYVYGASSTQERKRYAPRLLQLEQIKLSLLAGANYFDLGGVSPTLRGDHELSGLTRFKTTMGADVMETVGEWDYAINPLLAKAFNAYLSRR